jgi:SAM-dependent methyltransferase
MRSADRLIQRWRFRVAAAHVPAGSRILDIGAHDGDLFRYLGARIAPSVGIDAGISSDGRVGPHVLLAGRFPDRVADGTFDAVTLLAVLEHLEDSALGAFAAALVRVLRPGGAVVVTMPSPGADGVLRVLWSVRLIDGIDLEAHHGASVGAVVRSLSGAGLILRTRRRFELGFNNLLVFTAPGGPSSEGGRP